jgi:predicted RNA binding protein YcfA (HicA-like mRNA interferase family)
MLMSSAECVYIHTMRSREVIAALEAAGWREVARKGSRSVQASDHTGPRYGSSSKARHPKGGTLRSIERQSNLKLR